MSQNTAQDKFSELRNQAERLLALKGNVPGLAYDDDPLKLIHELQTLQIELELQNEELHRSQQELMQSQINYTELYDFAPVGYITTSLKGLILGSNLILSDMLQTERSLLINQPLSAFIHIEDQDIYYRHQKNLSESKTRQISELRLQPKDGAILDVQLESTVVPNKAGDPERYRTVVSDISERKQAEQWKLLNIRILDRINKSEVWKDCIEEILTEIKQFTGLQAVAIRLNEGEDFPYYVTKGFPEHFVEAERYLCTRDSMGEIKRDSNGNPYVECMCGNIICSRTDDSKGFFTEGGSFWSNNTSKLLSESTDEDRQTRTRNRCNSEGYESVGLFPLKAGNEILGLLQLNDKRLHQFTEENIKLFEEIGLYIGTAFSKKRLKDALSESEKKYKELIEGTDDIVIKIDKDGSFLFANYVCEDIFGFSREDIVGKLVFDFIHPEDQEKTQSWFEECVEKNLDKGTIENRLINKITGKTSHVLWTSNLKYDKEDQLKETNCIGHDITRYKQSEDELRQARKMESIGILAGGVAHDFNNLLYMIIGNTELALEDIPEWNPVHESLKEIKSASLRAAGVVKQLLNFSRKTDPNFKPIGAVTVIKDALKFLKSTIPSTVELKLNLPDTDIPIQGDPVQITPS